MITEKEIIERKQKLKQSFKGQRIYTTQDDARPFDLLDDKWQLGTKKYLYLEWMYGQVVDDDTFMDIRKLLAHSAMTKSAGTTILHSYPFKKLEGNLTLSNLMQVWPTLSSAGKFGMLGAFSSGVDADIKCFSELYEFTLANQPKIEKRNFLDPVKGSYSEFEYDSIKKAMRLAVEQQTQDLEDNPLLNSNELHRFSILIACQLMNALTRRPIQLVMMKWSDFLPVGQSFSDYRLAKSESTPSDEPLLSDIETLHVRTFKGKTGEFRGSAETKSQHIIPELSALIMLYRQKYAQTLCAKLKENGVELNIVELAELMPSCPVFFEQSMLFTPFESKLQLFKAIGLNSDAFHKHSVGLQTNIADYTKKLNFESERIANDKLTFGNNRLRHTVLTQGARQGLSAPYLAAITGVTEQSVHHYIDLSFEARLDIDQRMAKNHVLNNFARQPVHNLEQQQGFVVTNEYDQKIGIQLNPASCQRCTAKQGVPMGCYSCEHFRPHQDADHTYYLHKAERKFEFNEKAGADRNTLKKLRKSIVYIKATIDVCEELKVTEKGLTHA